MALVLALFFGIWLFLLIRADEAKSYQNVRNYNKEHPPHKWQEEYLLACEYYQKFIKAPKCKEPKKESLIAARTDIYNSGYRPTLLWKAPMSYFPNIESDLGRELYYGHPQIIPELLPDLDTLLLCRKNDEEEFPSLKTEFGDDKWKEYCDRMDNWYFELIESHNKFVEQQISEYPYEMLHRVLSVMLRRFERLEDFNHMTIRQFIEKYSQKDYEEAQRDHYYKFYMKEQYWWKHD